MLEIEGEEEKAGSGVEISCVEKARGKYIRMWTSIACWDGGEI
jgi:hypothetical protein